MSTFYDVPPLEGYDPQIGLLLASLNDSTREWREHLGEPSVEAIVWQPCEGFHSIGGLILHNIDVEVYWFEQYAADMDRDPEELRLLLSKEIDQEKVQWPMPPAQPISWYYELHDKVRARALDALKGLPPEKFFDEGHWSCSLRWVVAHVVEHDAYHGGQAVLLHELWKKTAATT